MNFLKSLIIKPIEGYLLLTSWLILTLLYLQIVFSATAIFCMVGLLSFYFIEFQFALNVIYGASLLGFVSGVVWAERIRKRHGIVTFHGYLLSTPEIEGWRDKDGNIVRSRYQQKSFKQEIPS
ncbi:hypothetical protein SOPP22_12555 [Shewanella sp. OPT22]|nr:hypothetical protein SOPP22_12555 [Shewanella sp. OPT22]